VDIQVVAIEKPAEVNVILGMAHFIKTVEDLHETLVSSLPNPKFGIAFCEASCDRLVRLSSTDEAMGELARKNALALGCGHSFLVFLDGCYPINVLNAVKACPEVCRIFCATANEVKVLVAQEGDGRGILGVIDGCTPLGVENETQELARKDLLRTIGYKL
jgi:adenosine/AMP kinase